METKQNMKKDIWNNIEDYNDKNLKSSHSEITQSSSI